MTALPRVSIITPSYNQAAYLEDTIRSVLSQGYPNLEYIIVDGGSTDGSVDIIRRYASQLAWWVSEKDSGQADAVNKGFRRASGEIIGWLNSDDIYLPGAITSAVRAMQAHPECGVVYSDAVSIDGAGEPFNVMTIGHIDLDALMQFQVICQPGAFMRRSVLEQAGYLDSSYHLLLDHHLWLRMAQIAGLHYVPERWAAARFHAEAKNLARAPEYGKELYRVAHWMESEPGLAERYLHLRRRVWAGACRVDAHYLLDGGQPGAALRTYLRGMLYSPGVILPEMRRVLFAAASIFVNVNGLKQRYLQRRKARLKV